MFGLYAKPHRDALKVRGQPTEESVTTEWALHIFVVTAFDSCFSTAWYRFF